MGDLFHFLGAVILGVCLPLTAIGMIAAILNIECSTLAEVTKKKTEFRLIGGCYVEYHGEMLPYKKWQHLQVKDK